MPLPAEEIHLDALRAVQPIGDIYIASIPHDILCRIAHFDVRRVLQEQRDVERYLGIQRPLNPKRVKDLERYVNFYDATFPTSIILAIDDEYVSFDSKKKKIIISNIKRGDTKPSIDVGKIARVLDGQHRIAGLENFNGQEFFVPVTIFVGSDIADQAYIFSTVNLEQSKVSKSLAYDLFALAKTRSPQRTCHNIAVALDRDKESPFFHRIKRLGVATPGRDGEMITQATFVSSLMSYISTNEKDDRDKLLRGESLSLISAEESEKLIFRNMFIKEKDIGIAKNVNEYFKAVAERWPRAWNFRGRGLMLNKTNGFKALMRFLRDAYLDRAVPGDVVTAEAYRPIFAKIDAESNFFDTDEFPPGSSGESKLYRFLRAESKV